MPPKAGYKGAVYFGAVKVGGSTTWAYGGETRNMQDIDEFGDETIKQLPLQLVGGDITISGNYLVDSDAGQKLLKSYLDAATEIDDIRLYTDYDSSIYLTPKAGSHVIVTLANSVGDDRSGVGTFTATLHVNGTLEQIGSTTEVAVVTMGVIDIVFGAANTCTATMWGELIHRGGEGGDLDCYFEYGLTDSFGTDSKTDETVFSTPDKDTYDVEETALWDNETIYYRAVCELADTSKVYGETKTFVTPAA